MTSVQLHGRRDNQQSGWVQEVRIGKAGFRSSLVKLSLSHCRDKAVAFAVAIESRPHDSTVS